MAVDHEENLIVAGKILHLSTRLRSFLCLSLWLWFGLWFLFFLIVLTRLVVLARFDSSLLDRSQQHPWYQDGNCVSFPQISMGQPLYAIRGCQVAFAWTQGTACQLTLHREWAMVFEGFPYCDENSFWFHLMRACGIDMTLYSRHLRHELNAELRFL